MTKAKAKNVISALLDENLSPTVSEINGDYTVRVTVPQGATVAQVSAVESAFTVTATVKFVEFN